MPQVDEEEVAHNSPTNFGPFSNRPVPIASGPAALESRRRTSQNVDSSSRSVANFNLNPQILRKRQFPNPSYAELPGLQTLRFLDLLVSDIGWRSYGSARFGHDPNLGTIRLGD